MEIKYTSDGKKVAVIGNLNSQEKIVQEIFIVNGNEFPSGENFVVKSLHDNPVVSWKQKELERIESEYETRKFKIENELRVLNSRFRTISDELKNKIEYAGKVIKNVSPESFDTLVNYLTGNIAWIVKKAYVPELIEWKDFIQNYEDKLRLISLYGNDNGTLMYGIGDYYSFSGGTTHFEPFVEYEDALSLFTKLMIESTVNNDIIKQAKKYNISLSEDKLKDFKNKEIKRLNESISSYSKNIEVFKKNILDIENL